MDEILASTLRRAVRDQLDYLDKLATDADLTRRAALVDTEVIRLTSAWRTLLAVHEPEHGRCPQCSGWLRPRKHPCMVWTTAHQHLIAADGPPPPHPVRHTSSWPGKALLHTAFRDQVDEGTRPPTRKERHMSAPTIVETPVEAPAVRRHSV